MYIFQSRSQIKKWFSEFLIDVFIFYTCYKNENSDFYNLLPEEHDSEMCLAIRSENGLFRGRDHENPSTCFPLHTWIYSCVRVFLFR